MDSPKARLKEGAFLTFLVLGREILYFDSTITHFCEVLVLSSFVFPVPLDRAPPVFSTRFQTEAIIDVSETH